jgi:cytochrome o ubiquinol oxidase subunit IV
MTDTRFDRAPGDRPILTGLEVEASSGLPVYSIGFALDVILAVTSFWVANTALLWARYPGLTNPRV